MKSVIGLIGFSLLLTASCFAQSVTRVTRVGRYDVPDVVLKAFKIAYPNASARYYNKVDAAGALSYEIEAKEGSSHLFDSYYDTQGQLVKVEDVIAATNLPANALSIIQREYAEAEVTYAEKVTERARISYRVNIKKEGKLFTLWFDSEGQLTSAREVKVNTVIRKISRLRYQTGTGASDSSFNFSA